jgi:hypothetical protein
MGIYDLCAKTDSELVAFHPGGTSFPPAKPETVAQRLLRQEAELLDAAIERHVHGSGHMRDLAVSIIALRAQVTG